MADSWLTTAMDNLAALDAEMGEKASRFGEAGLRETASWREKYLRLKQAVDAGASRREVAELRHILWEEGTDIVDTRLRRLEQRMGSLRREPYLQEQIGQTIDSRLGKLQQEMAFLQGGSRPDLSDHEVSALLDDMAREEDFLTAAKNKASDIKGRRQPRSGNSFEDLAELLNIEEDLKVDRLGQAASERKSKVLLHPASVEARRETARRALGESTGGELLDTPSLERELNPKGAAMADDVPEDLAALRRRIAKQVGGAVEETYKKKAPTKNPFKKILRRLDQQKLEKKVPGMVRPGHSYYLHTVRTGSPEQAASILKSIDEEGLFYRHYGGGKAKSVRPFLLGPLGADKEALALDRMAIREGAPRGGTVQGKGTEYMTRADPSTRTYIIELPNDITHVDQIGERITPDHPLFDAVAEAREARSPGKTGDRPLLSQTDPTAGRRSGKVTVNRQAWTGRLPATRIIGHIEDGRLTLKPQILEAAKEAQATGVPRGAAMADEPKKPGTPLRQARDRAASRALGQENEVAKWARAAQPSGDYDKALANHGEAAYEVRRIKEEIAEGGPKWLQEDLEDWTGKFKEAEKELGRSFEALQRQRSSAWNSLEAEYADSVREPHIEGEVLDREIETRGQEAKIKAQERAAERGAARAARPSLGDLLQDEGIPREGFIDFVETPENRRSGKSIPELIEAYKIAGELPESAGVPRGRSPKAYPLKGLSPEEPTLRPGTAIDEFGETIRQPTSIVGDPTPEQKAFIAQDPESRLSTVKGDYPEYKPQLSVEKARAALADRAQQDDFIHWLATRDPEAQIPDKYADLTPTPAKARWEGDLPEARAKAVAEIEEEAAKLLEHIASGEIETSPEQRKALLADEAVKAKWGPRIMKGLTVLGDVALAADLGYQVGKHGPSGVMDAGAHLVEGAGLMAELPKMAADRFVPGYGEKGVHLGAEMLAGAGRAVKGTMDPLHRYRDRQERVRKLEDLQKEYEKSGLTSMAARRQAAADIAAGGVANPQSAEIAEHLHWTPEKVRRELRQERRPPTDPSRLAQWGLKEDAENQRNAARHEEMGLDDIDLDLGIEEEPERPPMTTDLRARARWAAKRAFQEK